MRDVDKALAQIVEIRSQIAAGTMFRGFGPATLAATGVLSLAVAAGQALWLRDPAAQPAVFLGCWIATAAVSIGVIGMEMLRRSRRHHQGLSDAMIQNAVEQFLPAGVAGAALTAVILRFAPESAWMLPGLWEVLVSLGIFASARSLPRPIVLAGGWYLVAGLGVLMLMSRSHALSPWAMGGPFAVGQILVAAIVHFAFGDTDGEA